LNLKVGRLQSLVRNKCENIRKIVRFEASILSSDDL
jgi:hypothetical protein